MDTPSHSLCQHTKFVLAALLFSTTVAALPATEWFVDAAAPAGGNGKSWSAAWKTLAPVKTSVLSGDTVTFKPGDYSAEVLSIDTKSNLTLKVEPSSSGDVIVRAITVWASSQCVFDGLVDGTPRFRVVGAMDNTDATTGPRTRLSYQIWVRNSNGCVFRGLKTTRNSVYLLDTAQVHAFSFNNASDYMTVEHCDIRHTSGDGINTLVNAAQSDNSTTHGIYRFNTISTIGDDGIQSGYGGFTANDNVIDNGGQPAMLGGHPDGIQVNPIGTSRAENTAGARNIVIARNTISRFNQNIFVEYAAGDVKIYNNVIVGWRPIDAVAASLGGYTNSGIVAACINSATGSFVVANNTFHNFVVGSAINGSWNGIDTKNTKNNLFINCKVICGNMPLDASNYRHETPDNIWYSSSTGLASAFYDQNRGLGATKLVNPLLGSYSPDGLRLTSSSPIRDIAVDMSSHFNTDRASLPRPSGSGWDVGAFEYNDDSTGSPGAPSALGLVAVAN